MLEIGIQSLDGFHAGHACQRDALCVDALGNGLAVKGSRRIRREAEEAERIRLEEEKRRQKAEEEERRRQEEVSRKTTSSTGRVITSSHASADEEEPVSSDRIDDEQCTVLESYSSDEDGHTMLEQSAVAPMLLHLKTGKRYEGIYPMTSVGRSAAKCDIVLSDLGTVSGHHLDLIIYKKRNYVLDRGSSNGTKLNGVRLEKDERAEITDFAELSIASELFLAAFGECAEFIRSGGTVGVLISRGTMEKRYLFGQDLPMGRNHKWPGGAMSNEKISREHAMISYRDGSYFLEDRSTNGTFVNRQKLTRGEPVILQDSDEIRMGEERFVWNLWRAEE